MKQVNAKRGGHAFPKNVDEPLRVWIRSLPCFLRGRFDKEALIFHTCLGDPQVCHVKTRGSGGEDRNNVIPMCGFAHQQQHVVGIRSFEKRWAVNLKEIAEALTHEYERERPDER